MIMSRLWIVIVYTLTFFLCPPSVSSLSYNHSTANLDTLWINHNPANLTTTSSDNSTVIPILFSKASTLVQFVCGFYCNGNCDSYLFAVLVTYAIDSYDIIEPSVVWSANRNNPVRKNATLELTAKGDLVLRDADGAPAWSTYTAGRSVAGLNLTDSGNLVLFDGNSQVVWQSFDHPTDCLIPEQILRPGMNLTSSASSTNWSSEEGLYSVSIAEPGLVASVRSDPPQVYWTWRLGLNQKNLAASYVRFQNGRLKFNMNESFLFFMKIPLASSSSYQYIKLEADGHLRVLEFSSFPSLVTVGEIFTGLGECGYPIVCGKYGICSKLGQCNCPNSTSFRRINQWHPDDGCSEVIPVTCNALEDHSLLDLDDVTYFSFSSDIVGTDINSCKEVCLRNCSCRAAIFRYGSNHSIGDCFMPSQIFSLIYKEDAEDDKSNITVSVKVQNAPHKGEAKNAPHKGEANLLGMILGSTLGVLCVSIGTGIAFFVHRRRRRRREIEEVDEDYLDHVPGLPTRFSFEQLATATNDFNKKLGEGGFGSVFEGTLDDGTRIAVKRLDGIGYIKKSFLTKVQTIGNIHHINLVRLIGFCVEKFHRLLVYECMCNGSLERWIYCRSHETMLEWSYRRKIILDIAKGLAYLHEDCRQKIIHLDIKPQNILLDEHYNAKLADFGLSKLIERNQSNVITTMRGTPGYLAPEWLNAIITEKVDVYSFGVVILEILCGKKTFDQSRPEEERHLPTFFMKKAEQGEWLYLVDKCCLDVESNVGEVEEMMQISAWCLQSDYEKRPCMSMVIKVLEGVLDVQKDIDYNFFIPQYLKTRIQEVSTSYDVTPLLPSILSGPR